MDQKNDQVEGAHGTNAQASAEKPATTHLDTRPSLTAEEAALMARILRGVEGDAVSQEAKDDLANRLDEIANYNG